MKPIHSILSFPKPFLAFRPPGFRQADSRKAIGANERLPGGVMMGLRGACALAFALWALQPGVRRESVAAALGLYAVAEALPALIAGLRIGSRSLVILAIVDSLTGSLLLLRPGIGHLAFVYVAGAWAMLTGILEMFAAGAFRASSRTEWLQASAGGVSVVLGLVLGIFPSLPAGALPRVLGVAILLTGGLTLGVAGRLFGVAGRAARSARSL